MKASAIIANNKAKETSSPQIASPESEDTRNVLTTTQWLSVVSIFVSMIGIYYKREEIKRVSSHIVPRHHRYSLVWMCRVKEKASALWIEKNELNVSLIHISLLRRRKTETKS